MKDTVETSPHPAEPKQPSAAEPKWRALRLLPARAAWMLDNPLYRLLSGTGKNREEVLAWAQVEEGQHILELGPAGGYYTPALSAKVGENGKVYSVDIQKAMIDKLKKKIDRLGLTNIVPLVADGASLPLADESVDLVFALYVFEEVTDLQGTVAQMYRVLRPGGRMVIAQVAYDFKQDQKEAMRHFIPAGGFELVSEDDGRWTYRVQYRKV